MNVFNEEDSKKISKLYEDYREYVYWVCNNILHNTHDAEDAVQIAFMKIRSLLDKIEMEKEGKTKGFLKIVARNTAIDYYRKKKRIYETEAAEQMEYVEDSVEWRQTGNDIMDHYNYQCLVGKINSLPEKYADVLCLRYVYELSVEEIMKQLSLSETNIYARICRAKKMLAEIIDEEERNT